MKSELFHFVSTNKNILTILNLYSTNFLKVFRKLPLSSRTPVYRALPHTYRLWYYSALIDGSIISPANYINSVVKLKYNDNAVIVPIATPSFTKTSIKGFEFNYRVFTCEDHPVLRDILYFIESISPVVELDKSDNLKIDIMTLLKEYLTFNEDYYIIFLTRICFRLKLLKKLPSINTNKAQIMPSAIAGFFKLSKIDQLRRIVDAILSDASEKLTDIFPFDKELYKRESLEKLVKNSCSMTDFFQSYLINFGTDINELIEDLSIIINSEDIDDATVSSLSIYFRLKALMDSLITTPLGYYLQLIQPIYTEMYDFSFKIGEIVNAHKSKHIPVETFFFESCTAFDITPLGKIVFSSPKGLTNYQDFPKDTDFIKIFDSIIDWNNNVERYMMFNMLKIFNELKQNFK